MYSETEAKHVVKKSENSVVFRFISPMDCFCSNPHLALYESVLPKPFFHPPTQNFIDLFEQKSIIMLNPSHQFINPSIHPLYDSTI